MNSNITTLDPVSHPFTAKTILAKDGVTSSLVVLAPGDETSRREAGDVPEHLLFVVSGAATIRFDDVNTIVGRDEALLIPKGKAHTIAAGAEAGVKLLRVDLPPRQIVVPQIISMDR